MGVGVRIQQLRRAAKLTQRFVAAQAGLGVEYLSRIENERVTPSLAALSKIAESLGKEVADLFDQPATLEAPDRCPVSMSGRCVLGHLMVGPGRKPEAGTERYSADQLDALHLCNLLLHSSDTNIVRALQTALQAMLSLSESRVRSSNRGTSNRKLRSAPQS